MVPHTTKKMSKNSFELDGRVGNFEFLTYVTPPITCLAFIFCSLCIFFFSRGTFKHKLYKYLKYEAVFITVDLAIKCISPIYYCQDTCDLHHSLFSCSFLVYFCIYASSICEMSALICNILSAFYCYLLISERTLHSQRSSFLIKFSHRIIISFVVVFSAALYSYQLFQFDIRQDSEHGGYTVTISDFYYSQLNVGLEIFANILRDGVNLVILLVINTMLILQIRSNVRRKSSILPRSVENTCHRRQTQVSSTSLTVATPTSPPVIRPPSISMSFKVINEKKITKLIVINCFNSVLGRLPIMLYFVLRNLSNNSTLIEVVAASAFLFVYLSYLAKFFVFYVINKKFRDSVKEFAPCLKRK